MTVAHISSKSTDSAIVSSASKTTLDSYTPIVSFVAHDKRCGVLKIPQFTSTATSVSTAVLPGATTTATEIAAPYQPSHNLTTVIAASVAGGCFVLFSCVIIWRYRKKRMSSHPGSHASRVSFANLISNTKLRLDTASSPDATYDSTTEPVVGDAMSERGLLVDEGGIDGIRASLLTQPTARHISELDYGQSLFRSPVGPLMFPPLASSTLDRTNLGEPLCIEPRGTEDVLETIGHDLNISSPSPNAPSTVPLFIRRQEVDVLADRDSRRENNLDVSESVRRSSDIQYTLPPPYVPYR